MKLSSVQNLTSRASSQNTEMNFQHKLVVFIIIGVCSLTSLSTAPSCPCECSENKEKCSKRCFDCKECDYKCYDDCSSEFGKLLCTLAIKQCKVDTGCNKPATEVIIYPAINFDVSKDVWKPLTLNMRKNCCYELPAPLYDNTLSGLKTNGACVILYDGHGCTGDELTIDKNFKCFNSDNCDKDFKCVPWIDCDERVKAPNNGQLFNDRASSLRLC